MDKNTILRKLASRKFWAAVAAWATSLLAAFNVNANMTAQIVLIVSGIGSLCVYMFAEAIVDKSNKTTAQTDENKSDKGE